MMQNVYIFGCQIQFYTLYNIINPWLVFFYITVTVAVTITDLLCHHHHVKISHGEILRKRKCAWRLKLHYHAVLDSNSSSMQHY